VTVDEVHDAARAAVEQVDADLNAVADGPWPTPLSYDPAGPFAGAPFVVKDLVCHPRDVPMRLGSRLAGAGLTARYDTHLMARFRTAGLATVALATTPELGISASTEALVYGPTRNPWDPTRSPGGASGGSGALVAARAVPAAHANDSAGSIRIPAAACGLVGLKPSRGRVPVGPDAQETVFGQAVEFAVHADSWAGSTVDPDVRRTVQHVARELEDVRHDIEEATPRIAWNALVEAQEVIFSAATSQAVTGIAGASGLPPGESMLELVTLAFHERGRQLSALDLAKALASRNAVSRELGSFFTHYDVLITPTLTTPAVSLPLGTRVARDFPSACSWRRTWVRRPRCCVSQPNSKPPCPGATASPPCARRPRPSQPPVTPPHAGPDPTPEGTTGTMP
jgi:amidase